MLTPPLATSPFQQRPVGPPDAAGPSRLSDSWAGGAGPSHRLSPRNLQIHDSLTATPATSSPGSTILPRSSFGRGLTSDIGSALAKPGEVLLPSRGEIELQRRKLQTQNIGGYQCESAPGVLEDQCDVSLHGRRSHSIEIVIHNPPATCDHIRRPAAVAEEADADAAPTGFWAGRRAPNSECLQIITALGRTALALLTPALAGIGTYFAAANNSSIAANGNAISQLSPCNHTLPPMAG